MDWTVLHAVNGWVATHDAVEDPVTALAVAVVPAFVIATLGLWLLDRPFGPRRMRLACTGALLAAGVGLAANRAIALAWERPRPFAAHADATHLLAARTSDPSFPSDHATAAFASAVAVLLVSRRLGTAFLAAAGLVALSRVALGVHYPSDVLAGAVVGSLAALLVMRPGLAVVDRLAAAVGRITDPPLARLARATGHRPWRV